MLPPTGTNSTSTLTTNTDEPNPAPSNTNADTATTSSDRPKLSKRQSSQSSHVSLSLSEASSTHSGQRHHHHHHQHKAHRNHGRLGARNTSFGHNLNKLTTAKMPHEHHGPTSQPATPTTVTFAANTRPAAHARSRSGDAATPTASAAASPNTRPAAMKRNASAFVVPRNHSHSALKKNYSSGHLPRNLSGKALNKAAQRAQPKRKHSGRSEKSVPASPASPSPPPMQQPMVRFALADDEGGESEENEWTEESASVSPNVTRDHTRNNSVVLEPSKMGVVDHATAHEGATSGEESTNTIIHAPRLQQEEEQVRKQENAAAATRHINGESSFQHSTRPATLDADAITSKLLQRRAPSPSGSDAKVTHVSALVSSDSQDHRTLSHSQASTMASGTPGRDLVSRFVNAANSSADGTPKDDELLTSQRQRSQSPKGDLDASKRNKSAPNFADRGPISPAHTRNASRRSGTNTPSDLPPSRTQQKLLLQRASSALEPAKHIPAVLPRPGAAQLLGHGLSFSTSEGGTPAQIQALFQQIGKEYAVVRRYRNPVADAVARAREIPRQGGGKKINGAASSTNLRAQKQTRRHESPEDTFRASSAQQHKRTASIKNQEARGHKSRVSFDLPSVKTEESDEETLQGTPGRAGSLRERRRDETYDLLRRMWEIGDEGMLNG